jgi:D-alanyl-D-alanine carboxypeptidase (penicillin-binding protein 5/6)
LKLVISLTLAAGLLVGTTGQASASAPAPQVKSRSVLLAQNNKIVWSASAQVRRPIASLTKVMTAIVVLRYVPNLDQVVTIKKAYTTYGAKYGPTRAGLKTGDKIKVRDLLYGVLLPSGADAAAALADTFGPGIPKFVKRMNSEAKRLRLTKTHYSNPDGLPYPTQYTTYSTAYDQVKLAAYAMRFPTFRRIVATKKIKIATPGGHSYTFKNTNELLDRYPGILGIKTGYTAKAGYCFVFAARRGGRTVVGVVLGAPTGKQRFADTTTLLNWVYGVRGNARLNVPGGSD